MNTPAHADEAIRGLQESGIRSVFAFGFPNTSLQDWWFGPDYAGSILSIDGDLARRLRAQYFNSNDGLITMEPRRSTGLSFARGPVYWRVLTVIPDTPAASLSVQAGDLCIRINGELVAKWDYERYAALLKNALKITYTFLNGPREYDLEVPLFELVP
jgi:hypothetical protein